MSQIESYTLRGGNLLRQVQLRNGDRLLKRLAERVNKRGINETLLKVSRAFYLNYPQIQTYLEGKSATASHQLENFPIESGKLNRKSATLSHSAMASIPSV